MNERSLLLVIVEAREGKTLPIRFRDAALALLRRIGVPSSGIEMEANAMRDIGLGPTANRRVVGCLREAIFALSLELQCPRFGTLEAIEDYFAKYIYSTTGYRYPRELAVELFSVAGAGSANVHFIH
jgi:hypothetical protein